MKAKINSFLLFIVLVVSFAVSAGQSEFGNLLSTTANGQLAQLIYETSEKKPSVTPLMVLVSTSQPQTVSIDVAIDGFERSFEIKTEMDQKAKNSTATLLLPKPANARYYPQGRKIMVHAVARKNRDNETIGLTLVLN